MRRTGRFHAPSGYPLPCMLYLPVLAALAGRACLTAMVQAMRHESSPNSPRAFACPISSSASPASITSTSGR